jgi:hypothetical protein
MKLLRHIITVVCLVATFIANAGEQLTTKAKCVVNQPTAAVISLSAAEPRTVPGLGLTAKETSKTTAGPENIKSETKEVIIPPGNDNESGINTKYHYTESNGARLIIQNGFPRGAPRYKDPDGKEYVYAVFWTRIINETFDPLEVTIDFPLDSFEIPFSPGNYMKLLLSSDPFNDDGTLELWTKSIESFL